MIFLLYRILWWILLPIIIPLRFYKDWRSPLGVQQFSHRFGLHRVPQADYIVHAVSLGEVRAVTPLIYKMLRQFPHAKILFTATTLTGSEQIQKTFKTELESGAITHTYLPLDNGWMVAHFLDQVAPKAILIMETEIWPNLIAAAQKRGIPFFIISACLSDRSFLRYQKLGKTMTELLKEVTVFAQTEEDLQRFKALGVKSVTKMGNIKYELTPPASLQDDLAKLNQRVLKAKEAGEESKLFWIVASTHEGEESLVLSAFKAARKELPHLHLILAPRHPERFETVAKFIAEAGLTFDRRSDTELNHLSLEADLWLIDTLGELLLFYAFSHITTVAGSFVPIGGHNILEPAYFSKPIIVGPYMDENSETLADFLAQKAIIQVSQEGLAEAVITLGRDATLRESLGNNAQKWMMANQGGSELILKALE